MPIFWWLGKLPYTKFIGRELTSLAVAYTAVLILALVAAVARGEAAFAHFVAVLARPGIVAFHLLVAAALLFHSVTWLNLAPRALVVRIGRRRLADRWVLAAHYLAWVAVTAAVAWLVAGRLR